jgi:DNA-binding transcriptional regulator GbsR (MarR family)
MAKKIKITEQQLKNVMSSINEETYDQALTTHLREKGREVFMSADDAKVLSKLATEWCETRVNHPDCEQAMGLIKRLKLDRM